MIESVLKAIKGILKKPVVLLPALLFPVVMFALLFAFQEPLLNLVVEALFLENLPETTLAAFPVHLLAMYPVEFAVVALLVFVAALLWIATAFFYARFAAGIAGGEASVGKALNATLENRANIAVLGVFFFIIALFLLAVAWVLLVVSGINAVVGLALLLLFMLLLFYVTVKLAFAVPAMAVEGAKAKEALLKSWAFTGKRFWSALVFLVIVAVTYNIIISVGNVADSLIPDELVGGIVFTLFWVFGIAYSNTAIAFYYLKNTLGK